ncbi:MAG: bifunctional adenosylcobinamide kinase/adenosylcobinamide-phosphate guanylyltransferase [Desulfovibrio sp.]|nr:bifunctional adenosylcobinamide kinase/adenosylcobinamide-phosphate guanylyltransferase [Desulfovibrio sp.]
MDSPVMNNEHPSSFLFFLGGLSSGKSSLALSWAEGMGKKRLFFAPCRASDEETRARITRHRQERGEGWDLVEEEVNVEERLLNIMCECPPDVLLFDCLSSLLANFLEDGLSDEECLSRMERLSLLFSKAPFPCALVSLETGLGTVPMHPLSRRYAALLGKSNQYMAKRASSVLFVCSGLPLLLKGTLPAAFA